MVFIKQNGERKEVEEEEGTNVLIAAHRNEVDLEGLSCIACKSTVFGQKTNVEYFDEPFL
jgi:ferredoxin